jgi:hypothetical protein
VYVSGVKTTRKFLEWIRSKFESKLVAQIKGEILMLVPETADGFWATIGALRSLYVSEGVSFHTFFDPGGSMRAPVVEKLRQAHARSEDSEGARGLAHQYAGSHATRVKVTGSDSQEGPYPHTTLHCVVCARP